MGRWKTTPCRYDRVRRSMFLILFKLSLVRRRPTATRRSRRHCMQRVMICGPYVACGTMPVPPPPVFFWPPQSPQPQTVVIREPLVYRYRAGGGCRVVRVCRITRPEAPPPHRSTVPPAYSDSDSESDISEDDSYSTSDDSEEDDRARGPRTTSPRPSQSPRRASAAVTTPRTTPSTHGRVHHHRRLRPMKMTFTLYFVRKPQT